MNAKVINFKHIFAYFLFFIGKTIFFLISCFILFESITHGSLSETFVSIARNIKPSVVNIRTTMKSSSTPQWKSRRDSGITGQGSGTIADKKGHVITNNHLVKDANEIIVRLYDNNEYKAELVGTDARTDIAVLKINAENLKPVIFRDSDSLEIGEIVMAVGRDYILGQTVVNGTISAKGAPNAQTGRYEGFLQGD